jgi:hypothetical protein
LRKERKLRVSDNRVLRANIGNGDGRGIQHVWERGQVYTRFLWGNLRERDHLKDQGVDGRILRWIFSKWDVGAWTGLIWLRIGKVRRRF